MIKLKLDVESVKQQLLKRDLTELSQYIDAVRQTAIGTLIRDNECTWRVYSIVLKFTSNKSKCNVTVTAMCDLLYGGIFGQAKFKIASIDFSNGICETKSMFTNTIKVEFI